MFGTVYAGNLRTHWPKIGPKLARNWPKIGPKLARNWPKIGPKLARNWKWGGAAPPEGSFMRSSGSRIFCALQPAGKGPFCEELWVAFQGAARNFCILHFFVFELQFCACFPWNFHDFCCLMFLACSIFSCLSLNFAHVFRGISMIFVA